MQTELLEQFFGMSGRDGVGVGSGVMMLAPSLENRPCEAVKRKVDRSLELQGKEIQIEENYLQEESRDRHVRAGCPAAFRNTQAYIWEGQPGAGAEETMGQHRNFPFLITRVQTPHVTKGKIRESNKGKKTQNKHSVLTVYIQTKDQLHRPGLSWWSLSRGKILHIVYRRVEILLLI